jgi:thioredoxin reductase
VDCDVVIIGGGPAGWSAALVLGRCRRSVVVLDDGLYRNAVSRALNGFLTRDGIAPAEFLDLARGDALRYPGVKWLQGHAADAGRDGDGFVVALDDGSRLRGRKLLLATGVVDTLPALDGIERCYGRSVHHCPYCDGWEHRDQRLAVYGRGTHAVGLARMLSLWSADVALCTDGADDEARTCKPLLDAQGIALHEAPVRALDADGDGRLRAVVFGDGARLPCEALFLATGHRPRSPLPQRLGCRVEHGGVVRERPFEETSVEGAFVAGDASRDLLLVVVAAAEGAKAAFAINRALLVEEGRA